MRTGARAAVRMTSKIPLVGVTWRDTEKKRPKERIGRGKGKDGQDEGKIEVVEVGHKQRMIGEPLFLL